MLCCCGFSNFGLSNSCGLCSRSRLFHNRLRSGRRFCHHGLGNNGLSNNSLWLSGCGFSLGSCSFFCYSFFSRSIFGGYIGVS